MLSSHAGSKRWTEAASRLHRAIIINHYRKGALEETDTAPPSRSFSRAQHLCMLLAHGSQFVWGWERSLPVDPDIGSVLVVKKDCVR